MTYEELDQHLSNSVPLFDPIESKLFIPHIGENPGITVYDISSVGKNLMHKLLEKYHKEVLNAENPLIEWAEENSMNPDTNISKYDCPTNGESYIDTVLRSYKNSNKEQILKLNCSPSRGQ